jgi:hypothetical protein
MVACTRHALLYHGRLHVENCAQLSMGCHKQSMFPDAITLQCSRPSVEFDLEAELEDNTTTTANTQLAGIDFFVASPNSRRASEHEDEVTSDDDSSNFALDAAACADQQAARQAILEAMLCSSGNSDDALETIGSKQLNATASILSHLQGAQTMRTFARLT